MINFKKNLISQYSSILEALYKLNETPESLTLFVIDEDERLVGILTAEDIRRGLINGNALNDSVHKFMFRSYHKVWDGFTIKDFKIARNMGIKLLPVLDECGKIRKVYDLIKRKSILTVECVIMAGGRGERLRPLTDELP